MDSLISIAAGTITPKDAEFALLLCRLNKMASALGVAILLIHHLTKDSKRQEVTKESIFGIAPLQPITGATGDVMRKADHSSNCGCCRLAPTLLS